MSIELELLRIQTDRNMIRAKLVELGMATNTDNLDKLAEVIDDLVNRGAVSLTVKEGETVTIPAGYHNGSGTVSGVAGGGSYNLQSKSATPTKKQQSITPDSGYYGLSDVTIAPIPDNYQDVSSVNATAADVLAGKVYVLADGTLTAGTMPNNGAVSKELSATVVSYTIPKGYHSGSGVVSITLETKSVTPTKSAQTVTPTAGKVLGSVTVEAIPDEYVDTSDANAIAGHIVEGSTAYVDGVKVTGTMKNNATTNKVLTANETTFTIPQGYHDGSGDVIIVPETKTITPTKETQTVAPTSGKVISKVIVNPIPDNYYDTDDATATADDIFEGETAYISGGQVVGKMPNNGALNKTIDGMTQTSVTIPAGYTSGGTVSLTSDIEEALAAI